MKQILLFWQDNWREDREWGVEREWGWHAAKDHRLELNQQPQHRTDSIWAHTLPTKLQGRPWNLILQNVEVNKYKHAMACLVWQTHSVFCVAIWAFNYWISYFFYMYLISMGLADLPAAIISFSGTDLAMNCIITGFLLWRVAVIVLLRIVIHVWGAVWGRQAQKHTQKNINTERYLSGII